MKRRDDEGAALIIAVVVAVVVAGLSVAMLSRTRTEVKLSGYQAEREAAYQAAQAGADDYIARMTGNPTYFQTTVHPAESTRIYNGAATPTYPAGSNVTGLGTNFSYPVKRNAYTALGNGYGYSLEVKPPSATNFGGGTVVSVTGYRSANPRSLRTVEVTFKGSSIADFQLYSESGVGYGNTAVTTGLVYSGGTIAFAGAAQNNVFSNVTGGVNSGAGLTTKATCDLSSVSCIKSGFLVATKGDVAFDKQFPEGPPSFDAFSGSMNDAQRATLTVSGPTAYYLPQIYVSGTTVDKTKAYGLQFKNVAGVGKVHVFRCTKDAAAAGFGDGAVRPKCVTDPAHPSDIVVPPAGAIYSPQSVLVWGQLNGRVTVVTEADGVQGEGDYVTEGGPATPSRTVMAYVDSKDDVLGLVARRDILIPEWGPSSSAGPPVIPVTITGSVIAQNGKWREGCGYSGAYTVAASIPGWGTNAAVDSDGGCTDHGVVVFTESVATRLGGSMANLYVGGRTYNYDDDLALKVPPYFPVVDQSYVILRFREVNTP